jgi:hypothetical protein
LENFKNSQNEQANLAKKRTSFRLITDSQDFDREIKKLRSGEIIEALKAAKPCRAAVKNTGPQAQEFSGDIPF